MSEEQRVGQLFLLGLANDELGPRETEAITSHHIGSVWFVEKSADGAAAIRSVSEAVQALATDANTAGVAFFVAANQEGGLIQSLSGPGFTTIPSALDQSGLDPSALRQRAAVWGQQLAAAGVNLNFAPVLDVVPPGTDALNEPIGVLRRGYGHDAATVSAHGLAFLRGMEDAGIATTAKHFPGLGRVKGNTDFTSAVVDDTLTLADPDLAPFRGAVGVGVPFVMVALATYARIDPAHLAAYSPALLQALRGDFGFGGVIMSDDIGATAAVSGLPAGQRGVDFIAAGGDLIVSKTVDAATPMAQAIAERAATDASFRRRVDEAASRVLQAKERYGLLTCR